MFNVVWPLCIDNAKFMTIGRVVVRTKQHKVISMTTKMPTFYWPAYSGGVTYIIESSTVLFYMYKQQLRSLKIAALKVVWSFSLVH
jgi:hypothetical protein